MEAVSVYSCHLGQLDAFLRHAILAPQVATLRQRHSEVGVLPAERVRQELGEGVVGLLVQLGSDGHSSVLVHVPPDAVAPAALGVDGRQSSHCGGHPFEA